MKLFFLTDYCGVRDVYFIDLTANQVLKENDSRILKEEFIAQSGTKTLFDFH